MVLGGGGGALKGRGKGGWGEKKVREQGRHAKSPIDISKSERSCVEKGGGALPRNLSHDRGRGMAYWAREVGFPVDGVSD